MEQVQEEQTLKHVFVRQPEDIWRQLKVQAAIEGATLQATLTKAIQQYLEQNGR